MKKIGLLAVGFILIASMAAAQNEASLPGVNNSDSKSVDWLQLGGPLWDNGLPDGLNGFSNAVMAAFGARRTLLDDFVVPAGQTWDVTDITWRHVWGSLPTPSGTGVELSFLADNAGAPDTGNVVGTAVVGTYTEMATGAVFFSRNEMESFADFAAVTLPAGTYWIEATIVGPENNFWLTSPVGNGTDCWVNYDDLGGLGSCFAQFGTTNGISYALGGPVVPVELQTFDVE